MNPGKIDEMTATAGWEVHNQKKQKAVLVWQLIRPKRRYKKLNFLLSGRSTADRETCEEICIKEQIVNGIRRLSALFFCFSKSECVKLYTTI